MRAALEVQICEGQVDARKKLQEKLLTNDHFDKVDLLILETKLCLAEGNLDQAFLHLTEGLKLDRKKSELWLMLGELYQSND